ncbi:MAG: efflux RND transporter periplasmic adaptor subunit [Planctomycetota bacterium]|jgi:multidrug efflux pump subunit AcrA (membrane-fusion protein)
MTRTALDKADEDKPEADAKTDRRAESPPPSPTPPRAPGTVALFAWIIFGVAMLVVGAAWADFVWAPFARIWAAWRTGPETAIVRQIDSQEDEDAAFYTCGMHPWVILPEPGICPICHMDLTPLDPDKFTGEITIDPVVIQNIGVRIEPVTKGPVVRTIRTVGTVDYDETGVRDVNIKVKGWIEKLYVDYLGAEVETGQPLFDVYSPDLFEAQDQYLIEYRKGNEPGAPRGGVDLLEAARTRLEYFDITPEQIRRLEESDKASKTMTIHSPHRGVVTAKHANEGMHVDEGMQVYRIADLSKVWVMVTLYEYQLPFVQVGQRAVMSLPYVPGQTFEGKVLYVYPYLDAKTRQVSVRLALDNPSLLLKPGMYANVELRSTLARERTLARRSAILDTGERQVAFVSLGEGRFEPRRVRVGVQTGDGMVEILDGLKPGEMVVTSGQFLLDSEATIREGLAKMIKGTMAAEQEAVVAVAGESELTSLPPATASSLNGIMSAYFAISDTLSGDSTEGITPEARIIASSVDRLLETEVPDDPHFWHKHDEVATVRGKALELVDVRDVDQARLRFADLSVALAKLVRATGVPPSYGTEVHQLHCPMFLEGQGGSTWLQPKGKPRNPFMGSVMPECFDERSTLPVTGAAAAEEPSVEATPDAGTMTVALDAAAQEALDRLVQAYLVIQETLTRDETQGASQRLQAVRDAAAALSSEADEQVAGPAERIASAAAKVPDDPKSLRDVFEAISDPVIELVQIAPVSESVAPALYETYCPMVKKSWIQPFKEIANPYAPYMLRCGSVKAEFKSRPTEEGPR